MNLITTDRRPRKNPYITSSRGAIKQVFEFKTLRVTEVVCKGTNCGWRIYATSVSGAGNVFRIKKYAWKHARLSLTPGTSKQLLGISVNGSFL